MSVTAMNTLWGDYSQFIARSVTVGCRYEQICFLRERNTAVCFEQHEKFSKGNLKTSINLDRNYPCQGQQYLLMKEQLKGEYFVALRCFLSRSLLHKSGGISVG